MSPLRRDEKWLMALTPAVVGVVAFIGMGGDWAALAGGAAGGAVGGVFIVVWLRLRRSGLISN